MTRFLTLIVRGGLPETIFFSVKRRPRKVRSVGYAPTMKAASQPFLELSKLLEGERAAPYKDTTSYGRVREVCQTYLEQFFVLLSKETPQKAERRTGRSDKLWWPLSSEVVKTGRSTLENSDRKRNWEAIRVKIETVFPIVPSRHRPGRLQWSFPKIKAFLFRRERS